MEKTLRQVGEELWQEMLSPLEKLLELVTLQEIEQ
jgi:hypothetical protein